MSPSGRSVARRTGQVVTGLGALVVLAGLLVGGPVALIAFAGNPLPEHLPTLGAVGSALTSRDDGQLFIRALALVGWFGWATFALSVLVELPARVLRRPAPRLPGMRRQQRAAAALVGSVALLLAASPAAAATATMVAAPTPASAATAHGVTARGSAAPHAVGPYAVGPYGPAAGPTGRHTGADVAAPLPQRWDPGDRAASGRYRIPATPGGPRAGGPGGATAPTGGPAGRTAGDPVGATAPAPGWLAAPSPNRPAELPAPVYRVAVDDYLGQIADRYLGDFARYRELARLNRIADPNRIRPGQLLRLPPDAIDHGRRPHATGRLIRPPIGPHRPAPPARALPAPVPPPAAHPPRQPDRSTQAARPERGAAPLAAGAARAGEVGALNRPLAVSAVLAVAGMVGAQIGALLGLRRRPAGGSTPESGRHRRFPG